MNATKQQKQESAKVLKKALESNGLTVLYGGSKGHGFWIKETINPRTKTTWHSFRECLAIAK